MTLPLTPHVLAGCYDFLRTTPPYRGWRLPEADEVAFVVNQDKTIWGSHRGGDVSLVKISVSNMAHTSTLVWVMGHEMIHLHQFRAGLESHGVIHNADFRRKAQTACRYHGWDLGLFV